jgi:spermidine synthase
VTADRDSPQVLERVAGRLGELVLRGDGRDFEVISNGVFLMDTRNGASERLLVRVALRELRGRARLLIGGLGVGFSLAEALASDLVERITVVEIEPAVIAWNRTYLAACSGGAMEDPRVEVVCADLADWLGSTAERFEAICMDVDNGPGWTVAEANGELYSEQGLRLLREHLLPGGALTIWSAGVVDGFASRLKDAFRRVERFTVEAPRGEPDVVYAAWRD